MKSIQLFILAVTIGFGLNAFAEDATVTDPAASNTEAKKPLAVEEHDVGDVQVSILEVQRAPGDMLTVRWEYKNNSSEEKIVLDGDAATYDYGLARTVYLIDPVNKKKYFAVEDSNRIPISAKLGKYGKVTIESGKTVKTWAKFPAPPNTVQKLSIYIPGVIPFEEVPING